MNRENAKTLRLCDPAKNHIISARALILSFRGQQLCLMTTSQIFSFFFPLSLAPKPIEKTRNDHVVKLDRFIPSKNKKS